MRNSRKCFNSFDNQICPGNHPRMNGNCTNFCQNDCDCWSCNQQNNLSLFYFYKVDQNTGMGLSGAVFELRAPDGTACIGTSDHTGLVQFCIAPCTNYVLTEITPPVGYEPITTTFQILVDICEGLFVNGISTTHFTIPNTTAAITGSFTAIKVNSVTDLPLSGAEFTLSLGAQVIATATSESTGSVSFYNLAPGTYQLTETITPPGYQPAAPLTVIVAPNGSVTIGGLPANGYRIPNIPMIFGFTFSKVVSGTGAGLPGAVFSLSGPSYMASSTSDAGGLVNFSALAPGVYQMTETVPPAGYQPNPTVYPVVVASDGTITINGLPIDDFAVENTALPISPSPIVNAIAADDVTVSGTGMPSCAIEIIFANNISVTTTVLPNGTWSVNVPSGVTLVPGDEEIVIQTCAQASPSIPVIAVVQAPQGLVVAYNANGGTGSFTDSNIPPSSTYRIRTAAETGISFPEFELVGWNTAADGSGTSYLPNQNITLTSDLVLYAQWQLI